MTDTICDIAMAMILAAIYGIAKAFTDIKRDQPEANWLSHYAESHPKFKRWYVGGTTYSQRFPWDQDFWHFFDDLKLLVMIVAFIYGDEMRWEAFLYVIGMGWFAGRVFALLYHYLLPDQKRGSLTQWLINSFLIWEPENVSK